MINLKCFDTDTPVHYRTKYDDRVYVGVVINLNNPPRRCILHIVDDESYDLIFEGDLESVERMPANEEFLWRLKGKAFMYAEEGK